MVFWHTAWHSKHVPLFKNWNKLEQTYEEERNKKRNNSPFTNRTL